MPFYSLQNQQDSERDYRNIVIPHMLSLGWPIQFINNLLHRVQWGVNYRTFSIRITDYPNRPNEVPNIEREVRAVMTGHRTNLLVLQAYLPEKGKGPVLSMGITHPITLAHFVYVDKAGTRDKFNQKEDVTFRYIPFSIISKKFGKTHILP